MSQSVIGIELLLDDQFLFINLTRARLTDLSTASFSSSLTDFNTSQLCQFLF